MSGSRLGQLPLLLRTVAPLRPAQVAHRVRLRAQRTILPVLPERVLVRGFGRRTPAAPGWPAGYLALDGRLAEGFPTPEANAAGRFTFLEHSRSVGSDWQQLGASQLWRYHLHYFEWAWSFSAHRDRDWARHAFVGLWTSWLSNTRLARGDAWSPYVVSLRAWALCGVHRSLVSGSDEEPELVRWLGVHARFLRTHLERDVGGNHLLKNLKALVGLAVFLGEEDLLRFALRELVAQLQIQVLADGGHFERSPSYHCQVLADLLDVAGLLEADGRPVAAALERAIAAMRQWLGAMLMPDGDVPLFNDAGLVGAARLGLLAPVPPPGGRVHALFPSGYVVVRPDDRIHLVLDVGPPCPDELPAHAHADCLNFELAVDGERLVVDSGTSTYEPGERRAYERSTRAHNTVEVDGTDQTEVWGTFRAGRRARPMIHCIRDEEVVTVSASHDGYRSLPGRPRHRRTWRADTGAVEILDEVHGVGHHCLHWSLHVAGDAPVFVGPDGRATVGPLTVVADHPGGAPLAQQPVEVATGFGRRHAARALRSTVTGELPLVFRTRLELAEPAGDPERSPTIDPSRAERGHG